MAYMNPHDLILSSGLLPSSLSLSSLSLSYTPTELHVSSLELLIILQEATFCPPQQMFPLQNIFCLTPISPVGWMALGFHILGLVPFYFTPTTLQTSLHPGNESVMVSIHLLILFLFLIIL